MIPSRLGGMLFTTEISLFKMRNPSLSRIIFQHVTDDYTRMLNL